MNASWAYFKLILLLAAGIGLTGCMSNRNRLPKTCVFVLKDQVVVRVADNDEAFDDFDEFDEFGDTGQKEVSDPLEGYNRFMFRVNDTVYVWVLRPVSKGYAFIVPQRARVSVKSFFKNLFFPIRLVNNLLQLKIKRTGIEIARFGINSTLGLAGLFDPAEAWFHLSESDEDFGQTLGSYGVGSGPPLVLPILGFSNVRDSLSLIPDSFLNPINYVNPTWKSLSIHAVEKFNGISLYFDEYDELKVKAVDPYIFFRNAYKQNRESKVKK